MGMLLTRHYPKKGNAKPVTPTQTEPETPPAAKGKRPARKKGTNKEP